MSQGDICHIFLSPDEYCNYATWSFKTAGPFTRFAAIDDAFAKLPPGTIVELVKPENRGRLSAILTGNAILTSNDVAGKVMAADTTGKKPLLAPVQNPHVDGTCSVFVNSIKVAATDIVCPNGAISMIATVLMPKT